MRTKISALFESLNLCSSETFQGSFISWPGPSRTFLQISKHCDTVLSAGTKAEELAKWHSKNWAAEENWNVWIQAPKQFKEPLLPKHLFKNSVPMEPLGSLSNHIQAFNFLSITLSSKIKNKKNHPQSFPSLPGIYLSHTCRQRRRHLTGRRRLAKAAAGLLRLVLVTQGRKSGADQVATKRGKNSKRPWAVATLDALCLSGSALSPTSTWQAREEWKMAQRDWPNLHLSPGPTTRFRRPSDGLLIPWGSHDQHKAWWKKTKPWVVLGRAVGCVTHRGEGVGGGSRGWEEGGQSSVWNPSQTESMWLPSHEGVTFSFV